MMHGGNWRQFVRCWAEIIPNPLSQRV